MSRTWILGRVWVVTLLLACGSCDSREDFGFLAEGTERWIDVPDGRLKAYVFSTQRTSAHPVLAVVLHGDLPNPTYHYEFVKLLSRGFAAPTTQEDLVAVGILRPGYSDGTGDRSDGEMGDVVADNYTAEVVDAIAEAVDELRISFNPRAVLFTTALWLKRRWFEQDRPVAASADAMSQ